MQQLSNSLGRLSLAVNDEGLADSAVLREMAEQIRNRIPSQRQ